VLEWIRLKPTVAGWTFGLSLVLFVGSLIVMPVIIARMRSDYFIRRKPTEASWTGRHPAMRIGLLIIKNLLGVILFLAGIAMLVLPGQGIITIVVGISLLNFPGKRRLELRIFRQRRILRAVNWIRAKANRPPLLIPERGAEIS
jgi:hypothetical protein